MSKKKDRTANKDNSSSRAETPQKDKNARINTSADIDSSTAAHGFFSLLQETGGKHIALPVVLLVALLLRWTVSLWSYSGRGASPLYGDLEAQRHWLEITTHLPSSRWYRYDLQYWGLDYPPLTAYHSHLFGIIANYFNPDWVALDASRGNEDPRLILFMRYSAILTDLVINMSAESLNVQNTLLFLALIQPGLILIDHGTY
ncbi:Glucosyltransferase-like protein [Physocladia obscura]|uniref:Alpha-1,3-glucosyltransferase n=1 Tax=Physocladia obscura TaxID=109957 RepID=A0AAD5SW27_9FUNG|nr:Glucosyltransferase-like protein [Physocladia obscura]